MSKKRRAEVVQDAKDSSSEPANKARKISDEKLELAHMFDNLASDSEDARLEAALSLVQKCKNNSGVGKEPSFEAARPTCARLIRGLCSSRKSARHGFFVALVEVLRLFKSSTELKGGCLDMIKENTQLTELANGNERRNYLVGRMSAYTAVLHSKLFFHGSANQMSRFFDVLNEMVDLSNEVTWLKEQLGTVLIQTINVLQSDRAPSDWFEAMLKVVVERNLAKTPLGIAVWLETASKAPSAKLPKHVWRHRDPLCESELPKVAAIMKGSTGSQNGNADNEQIDTTGARQTTPSFVWSVILQRLLPTDPRPSSQLLACLTRFWREAVDENFFAQSASHEKRQLGFQIFQHTVPSCTGHALECLLSPRLIQCLINQSAQRDRYLHATARSTTHALSVLLNNRPETCTAVIRSLLCSSSVSHFDKHSGSGLVGKALEQGFAFERLGLDVLGLLTTSFQGSKCQEIAEALHALVRKNIDLSISYDYDAQRCVDGSLDFLSKYACQASQGEDTAKTAWKTLTSSLADLANRKIGQLTFTISAQAYKVIESLASSVALSAEHKAKLEQLRESLETVGVTPIANAKTDALSTVFRLLFPVVACMFVDEPDEAASMFEDISSVFAKDNALIQPHDVDVLVELLLSLASQGSVLYRRIAMHCFELLNPMIGNEGLEALLDVLSKKENIAGKNELEQELPEGDEESEDDDVSGSSTSTDNGQPNDLANIEIDPSDSDVEEAASNSADDISADTDSNSDTNSTTSELTRFNTALASTLGTTAKPNSCTSSSSDESMDDDQMLALEPQLTAMFRQRLGSPQPSNAKNAKKTPGGEKKQAQAAARRDILDFKNRVLDMLELFLTRNPSSPLALHTVPGLLRLVRTTGSKQLREKVGRILKSWQEKAKKRGEPPFVAKLGEGGGEGERTGWEVLESVHGEALALPFSHLHTGLCSSVSLFLCRCAVRGLRGENDAAKAVKKRVKKLEKVYTETEERARKEGREQLLKTGFWRDFGVWKRDVLGNVDGGKK